MTYNPLSDFEVDQELPGDDEEREDPAPGEGESPEDSPEDEGESPHEPDTNQTVAELRRKLRESEESLLNAVAENAALKSSKNGGGEGRKRFTVEQFKELAEKDDGKYTFDASVGYANQLREDILEEVRNMGDARSEDTVLREIISKVLPGWDDPSSENYGFIAQEKRRLMARGIRNEARAQEAAMFLVAARKTKVAKEDPKKFDERRRRERAGGEGAPTRSERAERGENATEVTDKMTDDDLRTAKGLGMKSVFDPDPKKRSRARRMFNERKRLYAARRIG